MKFFVVGMQCSGKERLFDLLCKYNISCGKLFSNKPIYDSRYELYNQEDIVSIFENKAYVFMKELNDYEIDTYDGLSLYEYDNNDVFIINPNQFNSIPLQTLKDEICLIWLDNTRSFRYENYKEEHRDYDFNVVENEEKRNIDDFIKNIYNNKKIHVLYFSNEDISHIFAITYALVKNKELIPIFEKSYN